MRSTVETPEPTKAVVTVEVEYGEMEPQFAAAYKDVAQQVNIPGFRKGHVPPRIIDQRFGRAVVIQEVVNKVVPGYLAQAITENKLTALGEPDLEVTGLPNEKGEPGGQLVFVVKLDVVPDFDLPEYQGYQLEVDAVNITDEDVQKEVDSLRTRFATLKTVERAAQERDFLTIDISATIDGKEIDSMSDVSYELGSGTMLEGQDEALTGASAGETVEFTSTIPAGEHEGETAQVSVTLTAVKERELPEVDDEFAMMVSEFDTAAEMLDDLRQGVTRNKRGTQVVQARERLLDKLIEESGIVLPEPAVETFLNQRLSEEGEEAEKEEIRQQLEREMRRTVLLDKLVEENNVQMDQDELLEFLFMTARQMGMDYSELFADHNRIQSMAADMTRNKALVLALREVKVTDSEGNEVDLSEFTRDLTAERKAAAAAATAEAVDAATADSKAGDASDDTEEKEEKTDAE